MTPRAGALIARKYRVERVLGQGGMGIVLAARDLELGRRVALKLLRRGAMAEGAVDRFLREARAAAAVESEHVARVLEVGRTREGDPYLVLERLDGEDLHARVASGPPARTGDAVRWILEACEGLAAAHARGIVHRDLKPSNLFLARLPDGREIVKLLDFGLAKNPNEDDRRITASGAILGSPSYMSPEHLSGRPLDARTDVWSLGVTLYEILTRALPFPGRTTPEICAAVLSASPGPIEAHRADVPRELDAIVAACLSKDPAARPASVAELAARLEPFADGSHGSAERIARALAHVEPEASAEPAARDAPTHLVSSLDALPRERTPRSVLLAGALAFVVAVGVVAVILSRRPSRPETATLATTSPAECAAPRDLDPPPPIVVPTVTAVVSATHASRIRPRPHPTARPAASSPNPLERF